VRPAATGAMIDFILAVDRMVAAAIGIEWIAAHFN
jgi:hypothetical protein